MPPIHLGISTCPNDTFAFHALLNRRVDWRGLDFHVELLDVQELNERLARGEFDVAKASFFAALRMTDRLGVFRSGSALGYSVGPLLLAAANTGPPSDAWRDAQGTMREPRVLCPGEATTAHLLYRLFHGQGQVEYAVFSDIMPSLQAGTADYGVCIHEGRFTWQEQGLHRVEDLGERWEQATNSPLPLGGILGRLSLDRDTLARVAIDRLGSTGCDVQASAGTPLCLEGDEILKQLKCMERMAGRTCSQQHYRVRPALFRRQQNSGFGNGRATLDSGDFGFERLVHPSNAGIGHGTHDQYLAGPL